MDTQHLGYLFLLAGVIILAVAGKALLNYLLAPSARTLPYRKKDYLLSRAERSFYEVLLHVMGNEWHVFPKVRLLDLLWIPKGTTNRQAHLNRVVGKHVDFVLCDRQHLAPVLVVELDDSSHGRPQRQARDAFVNQALQAAGLPILRVPVQWAYQPSELGDLIRQAIAEGEGRGEGA